MGLASYAAVVVFIATMLTSASDGALVCGALPHVKKRITCYRGWFPQGDRVTLTELGNLLHKKGDKEGAFDVLKEALKRQPNNLHAHYSFASFLEQDGQIQDAIVAYDGALSSVGEHIVLLNNLATLYYDQRDWSRAEALYRRALAAKSDSPGSTQLAQIYNNLGNALKEQNELEASVVAYQDSLRLDRRLDVVASLLHSLHHLCDWSLADQQLEALQAHWRESLSTQEQVVATAVQVMAGVGGQREVLDRLLESVPHVQPFDVLGQRLAPLAATRASAIFASMAVARVGPSVPPGLLTPVAGQISVGYLSGAFGDHPTSHLLGNALSLLPRNLVSQHLFSLTRPPHGCPHLARLVTSVGTARANFHLLAGRSPSAAAAAINHQRVHVLVDLDGYTGTGMEDVLALRPASVQIAFLGFHGSTGAPYIQGIVTDRVTSPPELAGDYTESLLLMTGSHFVADYRHYPRPHNPPRRPRSGPVYCNFGQLYKLDSKTLSLWGEIVAETHGELWLVSYPTEAETRVRRQGLRAGLTNATLKFLPRVGKEEHFARAGECDLYLDTPEYNSHTTATDALWSGLPLLTIASERMCTRVAASLSDHPLLLLARTMRDYRDTAAGYGRCALGQHLCGERGKAVLAGRHDVAHQRVGPLNVGAWAEAFLRTVRLTVDLASSVAMAPPERLSRSLSLSRFERASDLPRWHLVVGTDPSDDKSSVRLS
mmetsp:Transcript_12870/g.29549  ORF Transcript_12870/g.29549 Transcript_12870/m.29549 type:complete len:715 (-) Transcript_12870:460-2604(-)